MEKSFNSRVSGSVNFGFEIKNEGFYLIRVVARAGAWWQKVPIISERYRDDEELHLLLDDQPVKPYFNGNSLYGTHQNLLLCSRFSIGKHTITFKGKLNPFLEDLEIYECSTDGSPIDILPIIGSQAEDTLVSVFVSKLKSWITLVSPSAPILDLFIEAQAKDGWQLFFRITDDEDVQLIIDGEIQKNGEPKAHDNRFWCGHTLKGGIKTFNKTFSKSQPVNLIELRSDRSPVINKFMISFRRLPSVTDPRWTENFDDDGEVMLLARLILGEAERQPREAKVGVGYTVINRLRGKKGFWGYSVREIILKEGQYDGIWNDDTYSKVRNPFESLSETRKKEWSESYDVAKSIITNNIEDPTGGATFFHSAGYSQERFVTHDVPGAVFLKRIGDLLFYKK